MPRLTPAQMLYAGALCLWGLMTLLEASYGALRGRRLYTWQDTLSNGAMYAGYAAISFLWVHVMFGLYTFLQAHAVVQIGVGGWHLGQSGLWWEWVVLFLCEDLCFYAFHRSSHRVRFLWASHVTHHSSQRFNLSVAFRQTWTPFFAVAFWLPLPLLGFDPLMVITMQALSLFYQLWLHTELAPRLGPLEWVFNTPRHHRVHHGSNPQYVDRNFGGVLIVWDRLFGTFAPLDEPVRYGLHENLTSSNPAWIAFHEWVAIGRDLLATGSLACLLRDVPLDDGGAVSAPRPLERPVRS